MTIDMELYGFYSPLVGIDDWEHVLSIDEGGGYDWTSFEAFYSPSARKFFWVSGAGCSCDSIGSDVYSVADFENGDRDALARSIRSFAEDYSYAVPAPEVIRALDAVRDWRGDR